MDKDSFQAWLEHPVTKWVHQALRKAAEAQKEEWINRSWHGDDTDPLLRRELFTRADSYAALTETSYEDWCKAHGQNPVIE